jgi:hypothetical protein
MGLPIRIMQQPDFLLLVKIVILLSHGFHLLSIMTDNISLSIQDRMQAFGIPVPNAIQTLLILEYLPVLPPAIRKVKQTRIIRR